MDYKIYYYDSCSTCRKTKALLAEHGISPEVHNYFDQNLSIEDLKDLLSKLKMKAVDFIRRKDDLFKELNLDSASEEELLDAMSKHPKLIQRPVLVKGNKAVLCRPSEKAMEIINV